MLNLYFGKTDEVSSESYNYCGTDAVKDLICYKYAVKDLVCDEYFNVYTESWGRLYIHYLKYLSGIVFFKFRKGDVFI